MCYGIYLHISMNFNSNAKIARQSKEQAKLGLEHRFRRLDLRVNIIVYSHLTIAIIKIKMSANLKMEPEKKDKCEQDLKQNSSMDVNKKSSLGSNFSQCRTINYQTDSSRDPLVTSSPGTNDDSDARKKTNGSDSNEQTNLNKSRELKQLLALSKEANLDTNISHKRKTSDGKIKEHIFSSKNNYLDGDFKKSPKLLHEIRGVPFPVTAESELDKQSGKERSANKTDELFKLSKKRHEELIESTIGGATDDFYKKKKTFSYEVNMFKPDKDSFCWRCHKDAVNVACETCPRSYHQKCLKQVIADSNRWPCPECMAILKAESTHSRSKAMKEMTLEHLCNLLKFAHSRMVQCQGSDPFLHPVSDSEFPDYKKYIIQPMDLTKIKKNILNNLYGSTQAFETDTKWLLHNSIIYNSYQSKLTTVAKNIVKICKQEMNEIENCPSCYLNANTKKETWFIEVCPKPHLLVWAKLKGFPYWPAKAMCVNSADMVDVRFFGAHDRAWVHYKDCYLFSEKDPNTFKQKRYDIEKCIEELNLYIQNLKKIYGEFHYAPFRTILDLGNETRQLKIFLPRYTPGNSLKLLENKDKGQNHNDSDEETTKIEVPLKTASENDLKFNFDKSEEKLKDLHAKEQESESTMEGYGTDDEAKADVDFERRKERRKIFMDSNRSRSNISLEEEEEDDTQVSSNASVDESSTRPVKIRKTKLSEDEYGSRKLESDGVAYLPRKLSRRNSNQSVKSNQSGKSDSSLLSNASDKINRLDISKDVEVLLRNDDAGGVNISENISSSNSDSSKSSIVEANVEQAELSLSSSGKKIKIVDKIIKRWSDGLENEGGDKNTDIPNAADASSKNRENNKKVSEQETNRKKKEFSDSKDSSKKEANLKVITAKKEAEKNPISKHANAKDLPEISLGLKSSKSQKKSLDTSDETSNSKKIKDVNPASVQKAEKTNCDSVKPTEVLKNQNADSEPPNVIQEFEDEEGDKQMDMDVVDDIQMDKNKILDIIHSSLQEKPKKIFPKMGKFLRKRKHSCDENYNCKQKVVKFVPLEFISCQESDKESPVEESSILFRSLQGKKMIRKESLEVNTPSSSLSEKSSYQEIITEDIKSEPESDEEFSESENLEAKRKYLSALNISEKIPGSDKSKANEIRTRSKTEETRERIKTKPDAVSLSTEEKKGEIFVKSFAKLQQTKHRARKSFPSPAYVKNFNSPMETLQRKDGLATTKELFNLPNSKNSQSAFLLQNDLVNKTQAGNMSKILAPVTTSTHLTTSHLIFLPPNQTINYSNSVLNIVPTTTLSGSIPKPLVAGNQVKLRALMPNVNLNGSQNYIPQKNMGKNSNAEEDTNQPSTSALPMETAEIADEPVAPASTYSVNEGKDKSDETVGQGENNFGVINSLIPEDVERALNDLLIKPPPKLKPRPPGMLCSDFDEGVPSSAGSLTSKINSIAHRMTDYFRGMLIETLDEFGATTSAEAKAATLQLELESLKHRHNVEISEMKKNFCTILKEIQKSVTEDRSKVVDETRAACEAETIRRVDEAKSKQWCANCGKEAQFYCCWNTSYCDYPCQQKHWPFHMTRCTQTAEKERNSGTNATNRPVMGQQLILRPTLPPKPTRIVATQKFFLNRAGGQTKAFRTLATPSGTPITLIETTPGHYELLGNSSTTVGSKVLTTSNVTKFKTSIKTPVASPSTGSSLLKNSQNPADTNESFKTNTTKVSTSTSLLEDSD